MKKLNVHRPAVLICGYETGILQMRASLPDCKRLCATILLNGAWGTKLIFLLQGFRGAKRMKNHRRRHSKLYCTNTWPTIILRDISGL